MTSRRHVQLRFIWLATASLLLSHGVLCSQSALGDSVSDQTPLKVLSWNIWHGGREDGDTHGPSRVVEVIRESGADLIAMQETYGSGELIAKELDFHFHSRGTNVSILSRFPILEDISVFEEFKCVGALVDVPHSKPVAFYSIWLPFKGDIWTPGNRENKSVEQWLTVCEPSAQDLRRLHREVEQRLKASNYRELDVFVAGDFNSMSALDYAAINEDLYGSTVVWPTSHILLNAGFRDAYREVNPVVNRWLDSTWTPRFPEQEQDRIDYVYYRSQDWRCQSARNIQRNVNGFPSDHAAVFATFSSRKSSETTQSIPIKAATYNIRRGLGADNRTNIKRTADVIRRFDADVVALQEVDMAVGRSGKENQMRALASRLGMHAAFAQFMTLDGGRYGIGLLSRFPIQSVKAIPLPEGNEPRVALAAKVTLPDNRTLMVVNTHLDWEDSDRYRWKQATALHETLANQELPLLLLGDFNDQPDSRTIKLLRHSLQEAEKSNINRLTWPANRPSVEIDYLFVDSQHKWTIEAVSVVEETVASDHLPVVANLLLPGVPGVKTNTEP